jgi:general secretion pathway protein K
MRSIPGNAKGARRKEEGAVLVLILLVLTLLSVLILSWAQEWRTELKLASNFGEAHKCQRLAEAGIYYALGKLLEAKTAESSELQQDTAPQTQEASSALWQGDQRSHTLELPGGQIEIRIADEGGKINLNIAKEPLLHSFFAGLGLPEPQIRTMVDSILDWRSQTGNPRPYGAKSNYYLGLDPPYVAKNGKFETVEELAWVRGFEASSLIPQLSHWLTVNTTRSGININTAPMPVLLAAGFPQNVAQTLMTRRQVVPFRNFQEIPLMSGNPLLTQNQLFTFKTSPFFTITSTGMVKDKRNRYIVRAIIRMNINRVVPWSIVSWFDGVPG